MSFVYSSTAINNRLQATADTIDAGGSNGHLRLFDGGVLISTFELTRPCGTVNSEVLTLNGNIIDTSAATTGSVDNGAIYDSNGDVVISGLSVGIPLSGADIKISNGLNSTLISSGQVVVLLSAQIIGA